MSATKDKPGGSCVTERDIKTLLAYAALGWKLIPLYGIRPDGRCECSSGHKGAEGSIGKHPRIKHWQSFATDDEDTIIKTWQNFPQSNVGLLLGPRSGVIDVEYDTPEGRETAERMLAGIVTPTYKSGRSVHRLFAHSPDLPDEQKRLVLGLEVRIGGGNRATQSVIPPSLHHSGMRYEWLPGLSPEEVKPAELPRDLLVAIINNERAPAKRGSGLARAPLQGIVTEGQRNTTMLAFACRFAYRAPDIDDAQEQADLWDLMLAANATKFSPPLDEEELAKLHRQAINYARQRKLYGDVEPAPADASPAEIAEQAAKDAGKPPPKRGLTEHGLSYRDGMWSPGDWRLTIVLSDPVTYRLNVPAWRDLTDDASGNIYLTLEQFRSAGHFAAAVLSQTKRVLLDDRPRQWGVIWDGDKGRAGLKARLLEAADTENPPPTAKLYVLIAEYLLEQFETADPATPEKDEPSAYGHPKHMADGSLWFGWNLVWRDGLQQGMFTRAQVESFRERWGVTGKHFRYWPHRGAKRKRYCVIDREKQDQLRKLAEDQIEGGEKQ